MKTSIGHLQFNIDFANVGFYRDLTQHLGWHVLFEDVDVMGVGNEGSASLWFAKSDAALAADHDNRGLNHFGFAAESVADVDATVGFLKGKGVKLLYGTPCNRPEYTSGDSELYYSSMFLSPDGILFEVVYSGPK